MIKTVKRLSPEIIIFASQKSYITRVSCKHQNTEKPSLYIGNED